MTMESSLDWKGCCVQGLWACCSVMSLIWSRLNFGVVNKVIPADLMCLGKWHEAKDSCREVKWHAQSHSANQCQGETRTERFWLPGPNSRPLDNTTHESWEIHCLPSTLQQIKNLRSLEYWSEICFPRCTCPVSPPLYRHRKERMV